MSGNYTDLDYKEFLAALDAADFEVSDFEASFIESNLTRSTFTDKQRECIDRMIQKYQGRVKW